MQVYFQNGKCHVAGQSYDTPWAAYEAARASLAMDEESVRRYDKDGRMHVIEAPISKATVNDYFGYEIPNHQALGLDPAKKYKLWRHPEELKKAIKTFNNLPLLTRHVPLTSATHRKDLTVGTTGDTARFEHPYVKNSLAIWSDDGIGGIEDDSQRELSSSYHYRADMTPGTTPEGEAYDGVMRDIVGNHVALVREGRAGDDVVVGDSKPEEKFSMSKAVLSRKASAARGALIAFLAPRLAMDAKVDVTPFVTGLTPKNFGQKKAEVVKAVETGCAGKLAADASLKDLCALMDMLEKDEMPEGADADPETGEPMPAEKMKEMFGKPAEPAKDEEETEKKRREFLAGKLSAEDMKAYDELNVRGAVKSPAAEDDAPDGDPITKPAMDAAINSAVEASKKSMMDGFRAIRVAEEAVTPYVGKLTQAFDSADGVYKAALDILGVDLKGVHPSAYPAILKAQPKPGAKPADPVLAHDAKTVTGFNSRFPEAARIGAA